jgi:molybdopterin-containing oxidoreductase family iron-sulfur binding subunit
MSQETFVDLDSVRRRLAGSSGRRYWKSLEELATTPGFQSFLEREFPQQASEWNDANGRREFLRIMGASLALAGLTACTRQPEEKIVPYVKSPEQVVPGRPFFFATSVLDHGFAKGVLVESHLGRPTKVEGNPDHPASLGATDAFSQAAILGLYDPDRSQTITHRGEVRTWGAFLTAMEPALAAQKALSGANFRILTEAVTSPTLAAQLQALLAEYPEAKWHQYQAVSADNARAGAQLAFGEPVAAQYRLAEADVILSLEADFLGSGPANVRLIREFAERRRIEGEHAHLNRLYVVEGSPSITGAAADHRLPLRSSEIEGVARAVAAGLGLAVEGASKQQAAWVGPLIEDLQKHAGRCLVLAGESQPAAVHALAHAINAQLGNLAKTVAYTAPVEARPTDQQASLRDLVADMAASKVSLLLILGGNPVYNAPADVSLLPALDQVPVRVHLGLYQDETAERCHWHLPEAHGLESWGDARAFDGTASIVQPLIAPLYGGKSAPEVLAAFLGRGDRTGYDVVREHWKGLWGATDFEERWQRAVHDGVIAGSALPEKPVSLKLGEWAKPAPPAPAGGLEIAFRADPTIGDGRFANNGWLQELPKPLTKLTWENAALLSPQLAARLGVSVGSTPSGATTDLLELRYAGQTLKAPAWIVPGHPEGSVTVHLGYGRKKAGRVGSGLGFDAYALRRSDGLWFGAGLEIRKTAERAVLACTQDHWTIEQETQTKRRHIVRSADLAEFEKKPHFAQEMSEEPPADLTLYPAHKYEGHAWGMAIDLNACVGCNACVVACQSENNIPVVGKDQVARGREMQWLRVDRYYQGGLDNPATHHQPILCMHCENAPCEVVCPVAATVHSDEGLNDMVYNRCVGTRYCSNNCPYKVRRFNFFLYQDWETPSLKLMRNPDVTVRSRGVMEKCTYCVQRITKARIDAKNQDRPIRDGEIQTACQSACPAQAIVFGDLNDPESRVSVQKRSPRNYGLLADLNTRPRTTYLASVKNPNPEMPRQAEPGSLHLSAAPGEGTHV